MSEVKRQGKISEAIREAQSIVEAAEVKAARILDKAELAYEEAKASGRQEGRELGEKKIVETAVRLVEKSSSAADVLSEEVAKLGLKITEKLLEAELELNPQHAVTLAKTALKQSMPGRKITLTVNPDDADTIKEYPGTLVPETCVLEIKKSDKIKRGGCTLSTDFGEVDMRVETVISNLGKKLGLTNE